jgi:hypothetical protein
MKSSRTTSRYSARFTSVRLCFALAFLFGAVAWPGALWAAGTPSRDLDTQWEIKARHLCTIPRFIDWPDETLPNPDSPLIIGVLAPDPFMDVITRAAEGKSIRGHPLQVRRPRGREFQTCHVLFVSDPAWKRGRGLLDLLKHRPILTVGESQGFAQSGGIANFRQEDDRVYLEINDEAAKRARLSISSKLLRLRFCTIVRDAS